MKKKKIIKIIKLILKYLVPIVVGWIEGDSHAISDGISALFSFIC